MKSVMMVMAGLMMSSFMLAQTPEGRPHKRAAKAEQMKSVLSLNDNQVASIQAINRKYGEQQRSLRKDSIARKENAAKIKSLNENRKKEIEQVLTPEQRDKWATVQKDKAEKKQDEKRHHREDRGEKVKQDLSLSDAQWTKFKEEQKRFQTARKALGENPDAAKLSAVKTEHEKNMKSILDEQQFLKWKERKKNHPEGKRKR